jgi:hypothetical protein
MERNLDDEVQGIAIVELIDRWNTLAVSLSNSALDGKLTPNR